MKIPSSFQLMGQTITVEFDPNLIFEDDARGIAKFRQNKIILVSKDNEKRPATQIEQAFCHELVHWILEKMNEMKLCDDEKFVEVFGSLLHQALSTGTFKDSKSQKGE